MTGFDWTPFVGDRWTAENIGDSIKGKVVELKIEKGQRGDYPVAFLQVDESGTVKEVRPSMDLQRKMADANVQVGDWVAAELVEFKHTGQPQPMKIFKFAFKPGEHPEPEDMDPF